MKNWFIKIPGVLITAAALILLVVMVKILSAPPAPTTAGPGWVENNVQALQATLSVSTNPTEEAFIQNKLDLLKRIQATSAGALQNAPEKPEDACALRPTELPTPLRTAGVESFQPELYEDLNGKLNSRWQGEVNGQWVTVLAGTVYSDPAQAALWVFVENTADGGVYPAPQASGLLKVVSADQARLKLQDEAGTAVYFDIAGRAFLASPDEIVPTLAPQPTNTPTVEICPP